MPGAAAGQIRPEDNIILEGGYQHGSRPEPTNENEKIGKDETATSREVLEALRRVLLEIGDRIGIRLTDTLIHAMSDEAFDPALFRSDVKSLRDLRNHENEKIRKSFEGMSFKECHVFDPEDNAAYGVAWLRNPVEVLKHQILKCRPQDMSFEAISEVNRKGERVWGHAMGCDLAREAIPIICMDIMRSPDATWSNGVSFVGACQVYTDKTCQTLKASSHSFLPLHLSLLNMTIAARESLISSGETVVGYLPVNFSWCGEETEDVSRGRGSRVSKQRMLHESVRIALQPLWDVAKKGIHVHVGGVEVRKCHPALFSYVADTPEASDMLGTVHGVCARGHTKRLFLASTSDCKPREAARTIAMLDKSARLRATGRRCLLNAHVDRMWDEGYTQQIPAVFRWPFSQLHQGLDPYNVFRFEAMHNLDLGISKILKVCISDRLRSDELRSSEFLDSSGQSRTFKSLRTTILRSANAYLQLLQRDSPCIGARFDFSRRTSTDVLNGLFSDTGIAAMLEARNLRDVDQVMPFVASLVDRLCGEVESCPVTHVVVMYTDMVQFMRRRFSEPGFTSAELEVLSQMISNFKAEALKVFKEFQKSGMAFPKFHALDHVVGDIRMCGSIVNFSSEAYEASHKCIKRAFAATSRRTSTGERESVAILSRQQLVLNADDAHIAASDMYQGDAEDLRLYIVSRLSKAPKRSRGALTRNKLDAVQEDAVGLCSGTGPLLRVSFVRRVLGVEQGRSRRGLGRSDVCNIDDRAVHDLAEDVGGPARLLWFMDAIGGDEVTAFRRSNSAIVAGYCAPTAACVGSDRNIF